MKYSNRPIGFVEQESDHRSKIRRIMSHLEIPVAIKIRLIFLLALDGLTRYGYAVMWYVNHVVRDIFVENYIISNDVLLVILTI